MSIKSKQGGYALITALIFFLSATTAVLAGLSDAILREVRVVRSESSSKQSYFTSESALEDAIYRLEKSKNIGASGVLSLASSTADYTVTPVADGTFQIFSSADSTGTERNTEATIDTGVSVDFKYAAQAGSGGIDLASTTVTGSAYTLGSIRASGTSAITEAAIAAGKKFSNAYYTNELPEPPTKQVTFGNSTITEDAAESFTVSDALSITKLEVYLRKTGFPANGTVKITRDDGGRPAVSSIAEGTLSSSDFDSGNKWKEIILSANPILVPGDTYWIVIDVHPDISGYFLAPANFGFPQGEAGVGNLDASEWYGTSPPDLDLYFRLSMGSNDSGISGESESVRLSVKSAHAYKVAFTNAAESLRCQTGVNNNKDCDTSYNDPALEEYPVTDAMVTSWKNEAAKVVHLGNYSVGEEGDTLGPQEINGNLTVASGGTLAVSGTIWVRGNLNMGGGATIAPADSTKSYVIVTDGTVNLTGGATVLGGTGSHIMLVSTSSADPAITVSGGSQNVAVFAPLGGILISGNSTIKTAAGLHIVVSDGGEVIYDPDMAQLNFSSGANGGQGVKSWKEVE